MPRRIQMSRQHSWKTANTIIVDRTTKWGNVFEKDVHGTQAECAAKCARLLLNGHIANGPNDPTLEQQIAYREMVRSDISELRGKNLACWCKHGTPCHSDVLLKLANKLTVPCTRR